MQSEKTSEEIAEEVTFSGRLERFFKTEEDEHSICYECHKIIKLGQTYIRFKVGYPFMISGPYCQRCANAIIKVIQA